MSVNFEYMLSYWEQKSFYYHRDLIICGAGFTGLSAAIYFRKLFPHKKILVLEKEPINGGASTKNAGFACFGSPSELLADLTVSAEQDVFTLVEKRWKGLLNLRQLLGDSDIGYRHNHGFELFRPNDRLFEKCIGRLNYLNKFLKEITGEEVYRSADEKIANFGFAGIAHMIENTGEGQVDTGAMYAALLKMTKENDIEILNGVKVASFEESSHVALQTSLGNISCDQFLIATNGFGADLLPKTDTTPARAQVLITTPIKALKINGCFHMDEGFYYFRNIDDRVLLGGGRNLDFETEATTLPTLNPNIQKHLQQLMSETILPKQTFRVDARWSGIMGMGKTKSPIVKQLSPKVFCCIRLSGMGLALSTLLGKEVAQLMK